MKIYVIGSLKNRSIIELANELRKMGAEVFDDWLSPGEETDEKWQEYERARGRTYREALAGFHAQQAYSMDKHHLDCADIGVLVLPAGKSGHMEMGYLRGREKHCFILFEDEPERYDLMYLLATDVCFSRAELMERLEKEWVV